MGSQGIDTHSRMGPQNGMPFNPYQNAFKFVKGAASQLG
jgi:hypothetical protein